MEGCDWACAIRMGRLQESLSLSTAVPVVLASFFQRKLHQSCPFCMTRDVPPVLQEFGHPNPETA
eukprot:603847-Prorocentrum_minimum.AAC.1